MESNQQRFALQANALPLELPSQTVGIKIDPLILLMYIDVKLKNNDKYGQKVYFLVGDERFELPITTSQM